jgi:hypothetical protein
MIRMNRLVILVAIAALALAACGSDPDPDPTAAAPKPAAKPTAPADPLAKMSHAVGNGKPGAAVLIRYDFASKPAVGTPTEVQFAFIPQAGVDSLEVVISGMDGVTLSGPLTATFSEVVPAKPYMHTVTVLPDRAGAFYLTVVATTQIGNQNLSRTFAVPFAVGSVTAQQKAAPQTDASGQPVHPSKAQETTEKKK